METTKLNYNIMKIKIIRKNLEGSYATSMTRFTLILDNFQKLPLRSSFQTTKTANYFTNPQFLC